MQRTRTVFASFKGEGGKKILPKQTCRTYCLLLLRSQPRLQQMSVVLREDLGHPSEIHNCRRTPHAAAGCPEHGQTSSCSAIPKDARGAARRGAGSGGDLPARAGLPRPGPPCPARKLLLSPHSLSRSSSPSAGGKPGQGSAVPLPSPGTADHAALPDFKTRLRAEPGCFPSSWLLLHAAQSGYEKRRDTHLPQHPGEPTPLGACCHVPRPSGCEQRSCWILPSPQRQNSQNPLPESHNCSQQHPALPASTEQGFDNTGVGENPQPGAAASSYLRFWPRQMTPATAHPSLQLLRALVGAEAKSFLFQKRRGKKRSRFLRGCSRKSPAGQGGSDARPLPPR